MLKQRKIVGIFGNSQAMSIAEKTPPENTYPVLLQNRMCDCQVVNFSSKGDSIRGFLKKFSKSSKSHKLDVVVLQYGVVECCPRVLLSGELKFIQKHFPKFLQFLIRKIIHHFRRPLIKMIGERVEMSTVEFHNRIRQAYELVKTTFSNCQIVFMEIPHLPPEMEKVSPGISSNIIRYNQIIENECKARNTAYCALKEKRINNFFPREVHFKDELANQYAQELQKILSA